MTTTTMQHRNMGRSGLKLSLLGLGGWTTFGGSVTDDKSIRAIIQRAHERGVNFFDIADVYAKGESERAMGKVLADFRRDDLVISSKVFWPMSDDVNDRGLSRKHIMQSVERSLKRIGTDYLDIYFCHRFDAETPVEETARAMDDLVHQGKVLYWGTSEWTAAQLDEAHAIADTRNLYAPQVEQPQYSLVERTRVETSIAPSAARNGMGLVVWSPLASGLLSGKYDDGVPEGSRFDRIAWLRDGVLTDENRARVVAMKTIAFELSITRSQLALAYTMANPQVSSVITGATSLAQLDENLGALDVKLTPEVLARLHAIFPSSVDA